MHGEKFKIAGEGGRCGTMVWQRSVIAAAQRRNASRRAAQRARRSPSVDRNRYRGRRDHQDRDSGREYRDAGGEHAGQPMRARFERPARRQCSYLDVQRSLPLRKGSEFGADRRGASYSAAAASIPAISKANPTANQRSSGGTDANIRNARFRPSHRGNSVPISASGRSFGSRRSAAKTKIKPLSDPLTPMTYLSFCEPRRLGNRNPYPSAVLDARLRVRDRIMREDAADAHAKLN